MSSSSRHGAKCDLVWPSFRSFHSNLQQVKSYSKIGFSICFTYEGFTIFMQTNILNDLVWNLQVPAYGSNTVGGNELTLQSFHGHPTGKPRFH